MLNQAIEKIKDEMEKEKNPYVKTVGEFLINYITKNESEAEKIATNEDKTIMKSIDEMRKEAQKNRVGNVAMLTPEQGFKTVLKYFGIEDDNFSFNPFSLNNEAQKEKEVDKKEFSVELDDFL